MVTLQASANANPPPRRMMTLHGICLLTVGQSRMAGAGPGALSSAATKQHQHFFITTYAQSQVGRERNAPTYTDTDRQRSRERQTDRQSKRKKERQTDRERQRIPCTFINN